MNYNKKNKGSEWRKWDLHIHTPCSILNNEFGQNWDNYVKQLFKKAIEDDIHAIGITDYFTIEGYKTLKNDYLTNDDKLKELFDDNEIERIKKILILPNIEFRIDKLVVAKKNAPLAPDSRVNLHLILSDQIEIVEIEEFLNNLEFEVLSSQRDVEKRSLNSRNLASLGAQLKTQQQSFQNYSDTFVGMMNASISEDNLIKVLNARNSIFGGKYLIGLPADEDLSAVSWTSQGHLIRKNLLRKCSFIFSSNPNTIAFGLGKKHDTIRDFINEFGSLKPCIWGSDAHDYDKLFKPDLNRVTWIKAANTFEGLKQVIYEPVSRLSINESKPIPPPRKINLLKIDFPADTTIIRSEDRHLPDKSAEFCLRGEKEIYFSPYFTCIIGGRGTGKSTILNIIAKKIGHDASFFKTNILRTYQEPNVPKEIKELDNFITIEGTGEIEYISQNEVELFAQDKEKLTTAIYDRLSQKSDVDFSPYETKIQKNIVLINKQLRDVNTIHEKKVELSHIEKLLENDQKIVSSFDNPTYAHLTNEINKAGSSIERINIAKQKYTDLITSISELSNKYDYKISDPNLIEKYIQGIITKLGAIISEDFNFELIDKEIEKLQTLQSDLSSQLEEYLKSQGLSQENINDYERAAKAVPQYATQISNLTSEINEIEKALDIFDENQKAFFDDKISLEQVIQKTLEPLNTVLKSNNPNVKDIKFVYEFDYEKVKEAIFSAFWNYFENKRPKDFGLNSPSDAVGRYLFENDPLSVLKLTKEVFCSRYELKGKSEKGETQAKQYLLKLFESDVNFEIYKLLILRCCVNPLEYKSIIGFYDNRELKSCSFGQRCTAVIVALLTFGNKPLIIDEPEAHLDSKLIAEYLVDLVKQRKHERQIIFATHNANFVINGDAELVLHLEIGENNETYITPVSIENIEHREKLLLLEGGEEAFRKRERRLLKIENIDSSNFMITSAT